MYLTFIKRFRCYIFVTEKKKCTLKQNVCSNLDLDTFSNNIVGTSYHLKGNIFKINPPPHRGCAGGRIGTRFLHPRGTSPLTGVNPAGTPGYRNGTESFFGLKGRPSVVRDVEIHNQPVLRMRRK